MYLTGTARINPNEMGLIRAENDVKKTARFF